MSRGRRHAHNGGVIDALALDERGNRATQLWGAGWNDDIATG